MGICDELNLHFDKAQGLRFFMSQVCFHAAAVSNYHQHLLVKYSMNISMDGNKPEILQFYSYFLKFTSTIHILLKEVQARTAVLAGS